MFPSDNILSPQGICTDSLRLRKHCAGGYVLVLPPDDHRAVPVVEEVHHVHADRPVHLRVRLCSSM